MGGRAGDTKESEACRTAGNPPDGLTRSHRLPLPLPLMCAQYFDEQHNKTRRLSWQVRPRGGWLWRQHRSEAPGIGPWHGACQSFKTGRGCPAAPRLAWPSPLPNPFQHGTASLELQFTNDTTHIKASIDAPPLHPQPPRPNLKPLTTLCMVPPT